MNGIGAMGYGSSLIDYAGWGQYAAATEVETKETDLVQLKALKRAGLVECETCKNRTYQDGSNENDVSFKTPGHINPKASRAVVMAHEQEHVDNAYEKAGEDGKVIQANVTLKSAICPECGCSYVAGGVTNTTISYNDTKAYGKDAKPVSNDDCIGQNIDIVL